MRFTDILKRLLGLDPTAVTMSDDDPYEVSPPRSASAFFRSLPQLGISASFICLEGVTEPLLLPLLREHSVAPPLNIARGTIWPKPDVLHVPANPSLLEAIASLLETHGATVPCSHVFLYTPDRVVLQWYDAFYSDPIYISRCVTLPTAQAFAEAIGGTLTIT
jgi:hypothetical protein